MADTLKNSLIQMLRWSERYTKTDMVYLFTGGVWGIAGTVVTSLVGLVTVLAFANLLPKDLYGTYQYILSMADLFGIFVLAGVDVALGRSVARGMDASWRDAVSTKVRWGLVGAIGSLMLGAYYFIHHNTLLGGGFIIAGLAIPFWELGGLYVTYLQGKKRFDLINAGDVVTQFCSALTLVPTLYFTDNILIILTAYIATYGVVRGAFFFFALRQEPPNNVHDPEMVSYGKRLTFVSTMGNIAISMDKIILWQFLGPAAVAIYTFSQGIPLRAIGFLKIVNRLAFPKMAAQEDEALRSTLMHKIMGMVAISAVGALVYGAAAPLIFRIFFPQYMDAVPYTMVASLLIVLQPFSLISSAFIAQAKERSIFIWSVGAPTARIVLFLSLIPLLGLWGAMVAAVGAKALEALLLVVLFYKDPVLRAT
jgi:O-antigen/teichoic acid export membrane protein